MKRISSSKPRLRAGVGLAVVAGAIYVASIALVGGADAKTDKTAKSETVAQSEKKTPKKAQKKKLTGADLYAIHCGRCHPERYATEFTAAQWKTIMIEMRVRANLPAEQAKLILKYLQEDSGTP
jgi:nitrate/TMAO reductase-like tetraheme cytochrome c subunit